ncbi:MAG: response regulator [Shewanella sp.]|nr:response regulator [Shewanella sp.]MCF1430309.1 response regulator [Shewanella sp.]MCF1438864.1 response regulator [Shewanella sp.]MCF1459100.1 response regulator [Shewanella sp.]
MKILVVDDTITIRHIMLHLLRLLGYEELEEAVDGTHALHIISRQKIDLIITDIHMPKKDGFALVQEIKANPDLAHIPVMMVTCDADADKIQIALAAKVAGFIVKPFNLVTLERQLKLLMRKPECQHLQPPRLVSDD